MTRTDENLQHDDIRSDERARPHAQTGLVRRPLALGVGRGPNCLGIRWHATKTWARSRGTPPTPVAGLSQPSRVMTARGPARTMADPTGWWDGLIVPRICLTTRSRFLLSAPRAPAVVSWEPPGRGRRCCVRRAGRSDRPTARSPRIFHVGDCRGCSGDSRLSGSKNGARFVGGRSAVCSVAAWVDPRYPALHGYLFVAESRPQAASARSDQPIARV